MRIPIKKGKKMLHREIKDIIARTPADLKGRQLQHSAVLEEVGYYAPSNANWSYKVYKINYCGFPSMVVTQHNIIQ